MSNVITLKLVQHLSADNPTHKTIIQQYTHALSAEHDLSPISFAFLLLLPQENFNAYLSKVRYALHVQTCERQGLPVEYQGDEYWFDADADDEFGLMDALQVAVLQQHHAIITAPALPALTEVRARLNRLLAWQPQWSAVFECWFTYIETLVGNTADAHSLVFEWDITALFVAGLCFDTAIRYRINKTLPAMAWDNHFYNPDWQSRAPYAEKSCLEMMGLTDAQNIDATLAFASPVVQRVHALRQMMVRGEDEAVLEQLDATQIEQALLIPPIQEKLKEIYAEEPNQQQNLLLKTAGLLAQAPDLSLREKAISQLNTQAYAFRQQDLYNVAIFWYEKMLTIFSADAPAFAGEYLESLINLSFLYIKKVKRPQAALHLLAPIVEQLDAGAFAEATSEQRSKIRANFQAAITHMRELGEEIPVRYQDGLSDADLKLLDDLDQQFEQAIKDKTFEKASEYCKQALALLNERHILTNQYDSLNWTINYARALRGAEQYYLAIDKLDEVIELAEKTEHMHAKGLIPRALLGKALTYEKLGDTTVTLATYNKVTTQFRFDKSTDVKNLVASAYFNSAIIQSKCGDYGASYNAYMQAFNHYKTLGDDGNVTESLWLGSEAARKAGNPRDRCNALVIIFADYRFNQDPKVKEILNTASKAFSSLGFRLVYLILKRRWQRFRGTLV